MVLLRFFVLSLCRYFTKKLGQIPSEVEEVVVQGIINLCFVTQPLVNFPLFLNQLDVDYKRFIWVGHAWYKTEVIGMISRA